MAEAVAFHVLMLALLRKSMVQMLRMVSLWAFIILGTWLSLGLMITALRSCLT